LMLLVDGAAVHDGLFGVALVASDGMQPPRSLPRVVDAVAQQLHQGLRLSQAPSTSAL